MSEHIIRILAEANERASTVVDQLTGETPFSWRGSDLKIAVALATGGRFLLSGEIGVATLEIKAISSGASDPALVRKILSSIDANQSFSVEEWHAGASSLLEFSFTAEEVALLPGRYRLTIVHEDLAGLRDTFLSTVVEIVEDYQESASLEAPPALPIEYYTKEEAEARFGVGNPHFDTYVKDGVHYAKGDTTIELPYARRSQSAAATWTDKVLRIENIASNLRTDRYFVDLGGASERRLLPEGGTVNIGSSYTLEFEARFNVAAMSGSNNSLAGYYGTNNGSAITTTIFRYYAGSNGLFKDFAHGVTDLTKWNVFRLVRAGNSLELFVNDISVGVHALPSATVEDNVSYVGAFNSAVGGNFNTNYVMFLRRWSIDSVPTDVLFYEGKGLIAEGGEQDWYFNSEPTWDGAGELLRESDVALSTGEADEDGSLLLPAGVATQYFVRTFQQFTAISANGVATITFDPTKFLKGVFPTVPQLDIELFYALQSSSGRAGFYHFYYQRFSSEILITRYERHEGVTGQQPTLTANWISATEIQIQIANNWGNVANTTLRIR